MVIDLVANCPELKRLRFVGMMNFKSLRMLPLTTITRLEHSIGLAYLTQLCIGLNHHLQSRKRELLTAALYHDVNCGSFGHSVEWAIDRYSPYNHEEKASWIKEPETLASLRDKPIFLEQDGLHRRGYAKKYGLDFPYVDSVINGIDSYVINNVGIDLDNIDNVLRMAHYMGITRIEDLGLKLISKLTVHPSHSNFTTDEDGLELVDEWRRTRSDVYKRFVYSQEYLAFEHLIFELIGEYAKIVKSDDLPNMFHYTDEHLLWWFYNAFDSHPALRNLAKRLLLHDLPYCHGILRTPSFHLKAHLQNTSLLSSIGSQVTRNLCGTSLEKYFKTRPVSLHLTTDDRKTCRAIPIYVTRNGSDEQLVLGEDRSYLLLAVLSENSSLNRSDNATLLEVTAAAVRAEGATEIEVIAWEDEPYAKRQYNLL